MTPKNIKAKSGGVIARLLTLCLVAFAAIGASGEQHNGATTGGGFADFRKQQQARLFSAIDDTLSQKAEDTLLGFAAMRKAEVNLQTELGGRKGQLGVNLIGAFADAGHYATGWQLRAYGGGEDSKGVNAGVFYRQINNGNVLYGVNAFADYEDGNYGNFLRYSFGGEIRNTLFAINANYYLPETESRPVGNGARAYSRRGFDLNFRLNVPKWHFMKMRADYYKFDGKDGTDADVGFRYGVELALPPFDGLQVGVLYDGGSDKFGGDLTYTHTIGEPPVRHNGGDTLAAPDLFAAVSREYSQRIATTNPTVAIPVGGFDYHSRVFVTGFYGTVGTIAA
ncbi:MAG: inverse autotransporter beta domain-containing protein, partial [Gammaproteobacteria bacterium]